MAGKTIDFDVVRELALALPGVEEGTIHGVPSLKMHGKLLVCPAIHRSAEPDSLAVRVGLDKRAELLAERPDTYYVTGHYLSYPTVLVRMGELDRRSLRDLLAAAWRFANVKTNAGNRKGRGRSTSS